MTEHNSVSAPATASAQSTAPLAHFHGARPPAPPWFEQALSDKPVRAGLKVDDALIETLSWGKVGQPGLLLMHGNSAHADWYSFLAPMLARDYRVVAFSFSGMGDSEWREQYANAQWAEEAMAVARFTGLFDSAIKPVFLGHSFGGFPLMNACGRFGEQLRLAIIADTPLRTREQHEKSEQASKHKEQRPTEFKPNRVYERPEQAIARFRLLPPQPCDNLFILDHIARTSLRQVRTDTGASGWRWKFDPALFRHFKMGKPGADLQRSACPVAWLKGAQSSLMDERVMSNIHTYSPPGTKIVALEGADHHLMLDQPLAFVEAVRQLMAEA